MSNDGNRSNPLTPILIGLGALAALIGLLTFPFSGKTNNAGSPPATAARPPEDEKKDGSAKPSDMSIPVVPEEGINAEEEKQRGQISKCFDDFIEAMKRRAGAEAAALVDKDTFDQFDKLRLIALYDSPEQVRALPLAARMFVLTLRIKSNASELKKLTGKELFARSITDSFINRTGLTSLHVGAMFLDDSAKAHANLRDQNGMISQMVHFTREDGHWKLNFPSLLKYADGYHVQKSTKYFKSEEDYVTRTLSLTTGTQAREQHYQPMIRGGRPDSPSTPTDPSNPTNPTGPGLELPPLE
ncbi:MAG: hypothetical protein BIFFINMI_03235 [Phycisphaerae bacterium]|nr:hypothetical protein [Phycisphaerae bacterium]